MKVVKFGGTSLSSACNFLRCKDIALAETDRKIIVVSAPGKRFKTDSKVTDLLFLATCYHQYGFDFTPVIKRVKKRFKEIVCGLDLAIDVDSEFDLYISSYLKDGNAHYLVSRGEYLASKIFAKLIGARFIDAKDLFIMDRLGQVDEREALTRLEDLKIDKRVVVGGFYGGYRGKVRLFERGGGDISGAYLAKLLHADAYEIFSDVNGIMPINPDFVKTPNHVRKLTYREMELLDHLKAKVVNQRAVGVLSGSGVRLYIKNTFNPSCDGTEIFDGTVVENKITAIGCDGGYACVNLDGAGLKPNTIKGLNDCLSALKIQPEVIFFADDGIFPTGFFESYLPVVHTLDEILAPLLGRSGVDVVNNLLLGFDEFAALHAFGISAVLGFEAVAHDVAFVFHALLAVAKAHKAVGKVAHAGVEQTALHEVLGKEHEGVVEAHCHLATARTGRRLCAR